MAHFKPTLADRNCSIGKDKFKTDTSPLTSPGLYLDPVNTATCTGNLTALEYCYYEPYTERRGIYTIHIGVWRLDRESSAYREVWGKDPVSVRVRRRRNRFICASVAIQDAQDYVAVERGDSFGVLLEEPALFLVGMDGVEASEKNSRLLFTNVTTPAAQSVPVAEFSVASGRILHLYATISKSMFFKKL